jgi:AraC-like DNA-binding protein
LGAYGVVSAAGHREAGGPARGAYRGQVDVLSDAVAVVRTGRPHFERVECPESFTWQFPSIPGAGFHAVIQGACQLIGPDGPVDLHEGDVVFLTSGSGHILTASPAVGPPDARAPWSGTDPSGAADRHPSPPPGPTITLCGAYLFDRSTSHPLLRELPDVVQLSSRSNRHHELRAAVDLLGMELRQPRRIPGLVLPTLLDLLLLYILRAWFDEQAENETAGGWVAALSDRVIATALQLLHDDPGRKWTVEELGARVGLSRAAFSRRFTSLVGQPPLTYLTWWRMTIAARMLRDVDAPLSVVARRVGYNSEFAFGHAFKREYGVAPGGYRRQRLLAS